MTSTPLPPTTWRVRKSDTGPAWRGSLCDATLLRQMWQNRIPKNEYYVGIRRSGEWEREVYCITEDATMLLPQTWADEWLGSDAG